MKIQFLDLGRQPLANGFLTEKEFDDEFFFNLTATFDTENYLVSLGEFVQPEKMFNENYAYSSSCSKTMVEHFQTASFKIKEEGRCFSKILEIGSNDGVFIKNFNPELSVCVEPCSNFAKITTSKGYKTYNEFWTKDLANKIIKENGKFDIVYSANCMCHIQDIQSAFKAVSNTLKDNGIFIFEDPSILDVIKNDSYDQFYDEHAHIFSLLSLQKLLENAGLYIYKVEHLTTHGGSNRIYASNSTGLNKKSSRIDNNLDIEQGYGLHNIETYELFANRVRKSQEELCEFFDNLYHYEKVIGYGATSKSSVVYNYCGIGPKHLDYIIDTTPAKQGKYSPGTHIPIVAPQEIKADYAFLGAWNYKDEIFAKEKDRKFKFITHVPKVCVL